MIKFQLIFKCILNKILRMIIVIATLSACGTKYTKNHITESKIHALNVKNVSLLKISQKEFRKTINNDNLDVKSRIMDQYANWKGVRYRLGGNTKEGIDCSAFVQRTFREKFSLELPRSTYGQQGVGKFISRSNLKTGDLVLFKEVSNGRHIGSQHVGIYVGNNQFVHASSSNGVTLSSLDQPYWKRRYNKARRVLF